MGDFEVRGSRELAALAQRLKDAGDGDLRKELLRRIRGAAKQTVPDIRQSAYRTLPKRGGLAAQVGKQPFAIRSALGGTSARVSIVGQGMKELRDIDAGRVRHPTFGDRKRWKAQSVESGFFSDPIKRRAPKIRKEIDQAVGDIARRVTRGK